VTFGDSGWLNTVMVLVSFQKISKIFHEIVQIT